MKPNDGDKPLVAWPGPESPPYPPLPCGVPGLTCLFCGEVGTLTILLGPTLRWSCADGQGRDVADIGQAIGPSRLSSPGSIASPSTEPFRPREE